MICSWNKIVVFSCLLSFLGACDSGQKTAQVTPAPPRATNPEELKRNIDAHQRRLSELLNKMLNQEITREEYERELANIKKGTRLDVEAVRKPAPR